MTVIYEERPSDSPFVQTIWQTHAISDGCDIVVADSSWDILIHKHDGKTGLTIWGALTKAVHIPHSEGDECLGIRFKVGTFMPYSPGEQMSDLGVTLPGATSKSFWLCASAWQFPNFENVDSFLARLAHDDLLARDPLVDAVLQGQVPELSPRSVQRSFQRVTGLTRRTIYQIERARYAATLLEQGVPILDAVDLAGYTDQPHLTKAIRRYIGQTPAQIVRLNAP
jgi:AraC-like DNA-binding protein